MPNITVGFRRYNEEGDQSDEMGKYFGKGVGYDMRLPLHSIRVQNGLSMANGSDPEGKIVWKFKP